MRSFFTLDPPIAREPAATKRTLQPSASASAWCPASARSLIFIGRLIQCEKPDLPHEVSHASVDKRRTSDHSTKRYAPSDITNRAHGMTTARSAVTNSEPSITKCSPGSLSRWSGVTSRADGTSNGGRGATNVPPE